MSSDTICAIATQSGGALGIIRLSGSMSLEILSQVFTKDLTTLPPNTIHYGHIKDGSVIIDECMVSIFRSPHSYTGEDSAEVSCHGSRYILNKILSLLVEHGCRMANPGEYTQRAFLNGKMDLSQAEAVADLIASMNKVTHKIAMSQMRGHFSSELKKLREQLLKLTSLIELELDFSDHEDLEFANRAQLLELTQNIDARIQQLAKSFEAGQALKHGIPVAIIGKTNVGKSTLLNQLIGDDRAIVSDIHGTTRDTIEDTMEIEGLQFRFIDTAGIRQTADKVEKIGIDRTYQKIKEALIVIWLLDAPPTNEEIERIKELTKGKERICVHNKADLVDMKIFVPYFLPLTLISAKQGTGIDNLKKHIFQAAQRLGLTNNEIIVNNARHYDILLRAHASIQRVLDGLRLNLTGDLLAEDLRQVIDIIGEITGGTISTQETLNNIFQHFCVGK